MMPSTLLELQKAAFASHQSAKIYQGLIIVKPQATFKRSEGPSRSARPVWLKRESLSAQQTRVHSQAGASTSYDYTEETALDASQYYSRLARIAEKGLYSEAEGLLHEMVEAGLDLGPQAYHGLIFSCVRGTNTLASLDVLRAELDAGVVPMVESYAVVIYACILGDMIEEAEEVYDIMKRTTSTYKPGWLCFLRGICARGLLEDEEELKLQYMDQVERLMGEGRLEGWYPDSDLYEDILALVCEKPTNAKLADEILYDEMEGQAGVQPELRHYHCVMRAEARFMGVKNARETLTQMIEGKLGSHIMPDIESYNILLEGSIVEGAQGFSYAVDDREGIIMEVLEKGLRFNKRTQSLLLMSYLQDYDLQKVMYQFGEMEKLARRGSITEHLNDEWLNRLLQYLEAEVHPAQLLRVLQAMHEDRRPLPPATCALDEQGRSIFTRWLPLFYASQHPSRVIPGLAKNEGQGGDVFTVDDVPFVNNMAMDDATGNVVTLSRMTLPQLRAELEVKGLSPSGNRRDLSRKVQASRAFQPRPVREVIEHRAADRSAKLAKDREKDSEKDVADSTVLKEVSYCLVEYGRIVERRIATYIVNPDQERREADKPSLENLEALDLSNDVKDMLKQYRIAVNAKDLEASFLLEHMLFNTNSESFRALNPHYEGRMSPEPLARWPHDLQAANMAMHMTALAESLGATTTLQDVVELIQAAILDTNTDVAFEMAMRLEALVGYVEEDALRLLFSKPLLLCLREGRMDMASYIQQSLQNLQLEPMLRLGPNLQQILSDARE